MKNNYNYFNVVLGDRSSKAPVVIVKAQCNEAYLELVKHRIKEHENFGQCSNLEIFEDILISEGIKYEIIEPLTINMVGIENSNIMNSVKETELPNIIRNSDISELADSVTKSDEYKASLRADKWIQIHSQAIDFKDIDSITNFGREREKDFEKLSNDVSEYMKSFEFKERNDVKFDRAFLIKYKSELQ